MIVHVVHTDEGVNLLHYILLKSYIYLYYVTRMTINYYIRVLLDYGQNLRDLNARKLVYSN